MILPKWLTEECKRVGLKYCADCNEVKAIEDFMVSRGKPYAYCKPCHHKRASTYLRTDKGKVMDRRKQYRSKHGEYLTEEQLNEFAASPYGGCAICGKEALLYIDHCHKTLTFRDRLCRECNLALGFAEDSIDRLEDMIAYLRKHHEKTA